MSNKKQSSIELFAISLYEKGFLKGNGNEINDLLEEHKAMHKEEIKDAISVGYNMATPSEPYDNLHKGDKHYNETFGGNNETH